MVSEDALIALVFIAIVIAIATVVHYVNFGDEDDV